MSKGKLLVLTLIFGVAFSVSCSHGTRVSTAVSALAPEVMEARVNWLKDKESKFDFQLLLMNLRDTGVIVYLSDIECSKGGVRGEVKHTFFNTGERTIDFKGGENKTFNMVCKLGTRVLSKDFKLLIRKISANDNGDGRTVGKVLYRNLAVNVAL